MSTRPTECGYCNMDHGSAEPCPAFDEERGHGPTCAHRVVSAAECTCGESERQDADSEFNCTECEDCGYVLVMVDRDPGQEIERCDSCGGGTMADDDAAAVRFVRDLELGGTYAKRIAREMLK